MSANDDDAARLSRDLESRFATEDATNRAATAAPKGENRLPASTVRAIERATASTDPVFLTEEAGSRLSDVREAVADNPHTPLPVLRKLATDGNAYVRRRVTRNLSSPVELLRTLVGDADPVAKMTATRRIAELEEEASGRQPVSPLPDASRYDLVVALAARSDTSVREVLSLLATTPAVLPAVVRIAADRRSDFLRFVTEAVAADAGVSVEVAGELLSALFAPTT